MAKWIGCVFVFLFSFCSANATHIVGAEFQYVQTGSQTGTVSYLVTFKLYMDCQTGGPDAIMKEDLGRFVIFTGGGAYVNDLTVPWKNKDFLPADFENNCIANVPTVCLLRNIYEFPVTLPANSEGYYIVQSNCCRNESIVNIANPGDAGASYYAYLPPNIINNSAYFTNVPPQIICVNEPFIYNHAAQDPDGDSLSYELGPAASADTKIVGSGVEVTVTAPPFPTVNYVGVFTAKKPMLGNPVVAINPATGLITGTPNMAGRYVVSVYCHEWRNGQKINTVIRDYQFVVTNCSKLVVANIPQYSEEFNTYIVECKSNTVRFDNISKGGTSYHWDFGVPGMITDTSNQFSPTFTYPDTGTYSVKLYVNPGETCRDSISRLVKVYPSFTGHFLFDGLKCPGAPIQFRDSSISTTKYVTDYWLWNFGDGVTSLDQNPVHTYPQGGIYPVVLVSKNQRGCADTVLNKVLIENFHPFAGDDTIIVKGESINFHAGGGGSYLWTPGLYLNSTTVGNPVGYYPDTGQFTYVVDIVSPNQCTGSDTINVYVVNQSALFVPTGFTPNGDGLNDLLRPVGIGFRDLLFFRVFNRWGEQVFYTTRFKEGWDGTIKGRPADVGTYYWVLSIVDRFGKEQLLKGDAALIR